MNKKQPEFNTYYGTDSIEYRFKFYDTDEREIHKRIIHHLVEQLAVLKLHKDKILQECD